MAQPAKRNELLRKSENMLSMVLHRLCSGHSHFKRLFSQMPPAISSRVLMNPLMIFIKIIKLR
ncbi:hypothetical protein BOS62_RS23530, partial [Escherichia coli]